MPHQQRGRNPVVNIRGKMQPAKTHRKRRNYLWSELMKRVFALDILECPRCFGRMRLVSAIHSTEALRRILDCLGLSSRAPPLSPIRPDIFLRVEEAAHRGRITLSVSAVSGFVPN